MKVLIAANNDMGLYLFRKELVLELLKDNEVTLVLPKGSYFDYFTELGCKIVELNFDRHGTNPVKELSLISQYKKILKSSKPDIVLTYTIKPNVYAGMACAALKIPYVANITGLGTALEYGGIMQKITLALYKVGLRKAQKVFFQNTENRDFMLKHHAIKSPYDVLPGSGVNLESFAYQPYPHGETVDFLFVARLMKEKGIDQYIDAAKYFRKKYPNTRFHICGGYEQAYKEVVENLAAENIVEYHGVVKDMKPVYAMAQCTVHPTYYPEGLSNVLLESSATGRPIITTDRSGCREVVDDGVNGFVVKEKDSQDLVDKIEQFLALSWGEKQQMGKAGRAKVEQFFDRQIVIRKYLEEIDKARKCCYRDIETGSC